VFRVAPRREPMTHAVMALLNETPAMTKVM
jgi:hypothetical protein